MAGLVVRLEFSLRFELASGIHTSGDLAKLWVDRALAVDLQEGKTPVIPATTIKGWLRENAERILRSVGLDVCDGSRAGNVCGTCVVCRVFGHPRKRSPLMFSDARLVDAQVLSRTNVSLSRHRRSSYEERLFLTEVAWSKIFVASGAGFFPTSDEARRVAVLIWLSAQAGFSLGASRSRGLGWLKLVASEFKIDGAPLRDREIKALIGSIMDGDW